MVYMVVLDLFENSLEGPIPYGIGNYTSINIFFVHFNKFYGMLPTYLAHCKQFLGLDLVKMN